MGLDLTGARPTRRRALLVFAAAVAWGTDWASGKEDPSLTRVQESGRLVVGIDPSYPPFGVYDGAGQLVGYDVELAREVARRMGTEAQFVPIDIGGLYDALVVRQCDAIVGIHPLREFAKRIRYSRPYFNAGQVLIGSSGQQSWEGTGRVVGVESGSTADLESAAISERLGKPSIRRFASVEVLEAELRAGRLDGIVVDAVTGYEVTRRDPHLSRLAGPVTGEPFVLAVHYHDSRLLKEIDQVLTGMETNGFLHWLEEKWLMAGG